MKSILKHIAMVIALAFCNSAFAQSKLTSTPTTELYGYYSKDQNFKSIHHKIEDYEALLALMGYSFTRGNIYSERDYTLFWHYKFDGGGEVRAQIRYQFLIPYFKITVEHIVETYPNGHMNLISNSAKDLNIREQYKNYYAIFVLNLIKLINPAKTLTKEQFQAALNNLGKMPPINSKENQK